MGTANAAVIINATNGYSKVNVTYIPDSGGSPVPDTLRLSAENIANPARSQIYFRPNTPTDPNPVFTIYCKFNATNPLHLAFSRSNAPDNEEILTALVSPGLPTALDGSFSVPPAQGGVIVSQSGVEQAVFTVTPNSQSPSILHLTATSPSAFLGSLSISANGLASSDFREEITPDGKRTSHIYVTVLPTGLATVTLSTARGITGFAEILYDANLTDGYSPGTFVFIDPDRINFAIASPRALSPVIISETSQLSITLAPPALANTLSELLVLQKPTQDQTDVIRALPMFTFIGAAPDLTRLTTFLVPNNLLPIDFSAFRQSFFVGAYCVLTDTDGNCSLSLPNLITIDLDSSAPIQPLPNGTLPAPTLNGMLGGLINVNSVGDTSPIMCSLSTKDVRRAAPSATGLVFNLLISAYRNRAPVNEIIQLSFLFGPSTPANLPISIVFDTNRLNNFNSDNDGNAGTLVLQYTIIPYSIDNPVSIPRNYQIDTTPPSFS